MDGRTDEWIDGWRTEELTRGGKKGNRKESQLAIAENTNINFCIMNMEELQDLW